MRLTPLDIRKQEFSHKFRGYDADEVNAFLQMLANQWEELQDENRRREEKIRELDGKLQHYEKVEEALQEALQTARESSRKTLEHAEEKAAMMIDQAEARADEIKREAERERHDLKRETVKLSGRRSEIVTRLRAFLMSEMELLARYEGDDPVGFIRLLPADEGKVRRLSDREEAEQPPERDRPDNEPDMTVGERPWPAADRRENADENTAAGRFSPGVPAEESSPGAARRDRPDESARGMEGDHESERARESDPDPPSESEPESGGVIEGPGWTARTVVSRPSEQQGPPPEDRSVPRYVDEEDEDETRTRTSSEEIEKIRRILSDLD